MFARLGLLKRTQDKRDTLTPITGIALRLKAFLRQNRVPLLAFIVHLTIVLAVAGAAMAWFDALEPVPALQYTLPEMDGISHYLFQPLRNWDGFWYTVIATHGYDANQYTTAFWPLYPALLWFGSLVSGLSIPITGIILSNAAFLAALIVLYRLVQIDYSALVAQRTIWLLALFPTSYYFSAVYTESLFLLTTVTAVYLARTDRWTGAAVALALAAVTRNTGVLILIPMGLLLVRQHGWNPTQWWTTGIKLAIGALSPLIYLFHLDRVWGDPFLTLKVQDGWARYRAMPWETVADAFRQLDLTWLRLLADSPNWATLTSSAVRMGFAEHESYDVFTLILIVPLSLYMLWRVRGAYSLYALIVFILPLFTPSMVHPIMSIPRFVIVLFPFFIALGMLARNRWVFGALLVAFVIQFVGLLIQFSTWHWVA